MKAIEMFAGIGGFRIGLEKAGITVIWANDIEPKACAIYDRQFGKDSILCADIRDIKNSVPRHDLLSAGFPCQPFSAAGKKMGVHDKVRGTLFAEIVNILEEAQPDFFILENVKRLLTMENGDHFRTILLALTETGYFVEWRLLNAKHFGLAQNRERVFIVGRKNPRDYVSIESSRFISENSILFLDGDLNLKPDLFGPSTISGLLEPIVERRKFNQAGFAYNGGVYSFNPRVFPDQRSPRFLSEILQDEPDMHFDFTDVTNGWLKNNTEVNSFINGVEIISNQEGGRRMGYTIFGIGGIAPTLTSTTSRHYERYRIGSRYRRLTNVEYARLQGFSDDWCDIASIYDQYGLYGNAVPPVMVEWVAARLHRRSEISNRIFNARYQTAAASTCT